jgi:hypothetical protein
MSRRLSGSDSFAEAAHKLADADPDAVAVLQTIQQLPETEPISEMAKLGILGMLDQFGIYGQRIHLFYTDVCKQRIDALLGVLGLVACGAIRWDVLDTAIDNHGMGLDAQQAAERFRVLLARRRS